MKKHSSHDFVDRFGRFFEGNGLPRMSGRVMGHLLVCDPPEQTFDDIVEALGASRSMVSVATRHLVGLALIERFGVRGDRKDRYRFAGDAWTAMLQQDVRAAVELRALAEAGLASMPSSGASRARLVEMRAFTTFLEESYAPLLARWAKQRRSR